MKVEELRIGNLLRDKISKTELKVVELTENHITTYVIDRDLFPLKDGWGIEPIPLTEEWLVNFGFEKVVDTFYLNGFALWQTLCGNEDGSECIGFFYELRDRGIMDKHIEHVHQLQNLYWCLCGKELIIKK